ncbi:hypothetical protein D7V91_05795 [bacterium 1xD42-67]|nr:hypothetical protein [Lawsonibacter sp.]RKI69379.1 hypothetical protein D7V91_05795 [bacterium 1xD42-67]
MKTRKYLSHIFLALAILTSHVMCAAVAYHYCAMQWGIRYEGYSAPASVALLLAIPYGAGIGICLILARAFHK